MPVIKEQSTHILGQIGNSGHTLVKFDITRKATISRKGECQFLLLMRGDVRNHSTIMYCMAEGHKLLSFVAFTGTIPTNENSTES